MNRTLTRRTAFIEQFTHSREDYDKLRWYLLNISGRPDRFFKDTRVKQEVLMKPVRSLPQVIEMLPEVRVKMQMCWNQPIVGVLPLETER